jgi:2-keto-4-pentenoate hydratase
MTTAVQQVTRAAQRLQHALACRTPCAPVRDLIARDDVEAAYAVQLQLSRAREAAGAHIVGRKIGLTSPAVQRQLGVEQPDFGVLFDDMAVPDGGEIQVGRLLQPKVEAEIAFVLGADLDDDVSPEGLRAAVDHAVVALEIVDSRIERWDISFADTVADNASSGLFVLGARKLRLHEFVPHNTTMTLSIDGLVVSTGSGTACLGDPLDALAWLAKTARDFGEPLRAGQVVLSGALGPMVPVQPGTQVRAELNDGDGRPLGHVTTQFTEEDS